ncbi:MAG: CC0125/CC1285 family lipoprotein [Brevundimonas sp.]
MTRTPRTSTVLASLVMGAAFLSGCATPTPYHAASLTDPAHADGFRELQVEPERWRVVFAGNSLTSRETVETYLLYRAAELTLQKGYDWFQAVERGTEEHVTLVVREPIGVWGPGWEPHWRYAYGVRAGWRDWDRHRPDPAFDVRRVTAYEAVAEVVMRRGAKPADDARAFDARAVKASLEDRIIRPEA